ncbi:hypothetical protein ABVT39_003521 [Epinephelus coioides]
MSYHIVSFEETAEVEVVPALWVNDGVCQWPPYKREGVQRAIKNQQEPDPTWALYNARVLYTAALLHDLLVKQEIIIEQLQNIIRMVQDLHAAMHSMTNGSTTMERHHSYFPLCNTEQLMALEGDLQSLPGLKKGIGLAGGATMKDTVRGILKRAMRNDLALKVTWSGVNGKLAFERLHLKAVVVEETPPALQPLIMRLQKQLKSGFTGLGIETVGGAPGLSQDQARTQPAPSQHPARSALNGRRL